ncbi:MAG: FAD:protein FMN transferase [Herbinix sp.]|nr:FAD:protein FMN transferase [Herbinix sp.]
MLTNNSNIKLIKHYIGLCIILIVILTGCSKTSSNISTDTQDAEYITKSSFLLNTEVTINLYDKQDETILDECFALIAKLENIYSRTSETSELYKLNNRTLPHEGDLYQISDKLSDLLNFGLYYSKLSGGAFDISIEPITSLWDFTSTDPVVPSDTDIQAALPYVNYKNLHLDGNNIAFDKDKVGIDLGAIAKGYIADKVKDFLLSKGVNSAMINLGGNVLCIGEKPDGTTFHVGIQKPFADRNEIIGVMDINGLSIVSSGVYERCFTVNGVQYHHILNPKTGYSYDNGMISVTIISKKSVDGDGLSTSCFALGLEKGLKLINSLPDTYAVFITSDYEIHYSDGFKEATNFTLK